MAVNFQNPLFIDIETVGAPRDFEQLTSRMQALWMRKARTLGAENEGIELLWRQRAATTDGVERQAAGHNEHTSPRSLCEWHRAAGESKAHQSTARS